MRAVRLRPGLIFKREAAEGIRRLFAGPLLPTPLLRPGRIPVVPDIPRLRFQAVHSLDVGHAYRLALVSDARGAFNVAADPVLDPDELARALGARKVPVPRGARARRGRGHVEAPPPADAARLGRHGARSAAPGHHARPHRARLGAAADGRPRRCSSCSEGMHDRAGIDTPPLARGTSGPARVRELATGVGRRQGN